jgi:Tfp pilus assembly protein PilN
MIEINLLPREYRKRTFDFSFGKTGLYAIVAGAAVVLMLVGITFYQKHRLSNLQADIQKAHQRAELLRNDIMMVDALTDVKQKITNRMTAVERLDSHRSTWVRVLEDIAGNVPQFVWLGRFQEFEQASQQEDADKKATTSSRKKGSSSETGTPAPGKKGPRVTRAEIEGYSFTLNALASFMINMMRSDYFDDVELKATKEELLQKSTVYQFVVSCNVHYLSDEELQKLVAQAQKEEQSSSPSVSHTTLN